MLRNFVGVTLFASFLLLASPGAAQAALLSQNELAAPAAPDAAAPDYLITRQYKIAHARVPGPTSARQSITAWQVIQGSWAGQRLDGLSVVLVQSFPDDSQARPTTNCYLSIAGTPAQRSALLDAFLSTSALPLTASQAASLRVEPAAITFEFAGQTVVLHLALVA